MGTDMQLWAFQQQLEHRRYSEEQQLKRTCKKQILHLYMENIPDKEIEQRLGVSLSDIRRVIADYQQENEI